MTDISRAYRLQHRGMQLMIAGLGYGIMIAALAVHAMVIHPM